MGPAGEIAGQERERAGCRLFENSTPFARLVFLMLFSCERSSALARRSSLTFGADPLKGMSRIRARLQSCRRRPCKELGCSPWDPSQKALGISAAGSDSRKAPQDRRTRSCVTRRPGPRGETQVEPTPTKPVILPRGKYPFPSRTRKSSPAGPIVLCAKVHGRVGRRRHK